MNDIGINLTEVTDRDPLTTKENHEDAGRNWETVNNTNGFTQNGPRTPANRDDDILVSTDKSSLRRVRISICGHVFITREETLEKAQDTKLYRMLKDKSLADAYYPETDEYYFDRHLPSFPAILYFYQTGFIWRPLDVPMEIFVEEVIFYELADMVLQSEDDFNEKEPDHKCCKPSERTVCVKARIAVWNTFERPETSFIAKVINMASIFFIVLSTVSFCLETIPYFHEDNCYERVVDNQNRSYERLDHDPESKTFGFWVIETLCIAFFTIEYVLRCWSSPDRLIFVRGMMNMIDLSAILPYYVTLIFQMSYTDDNVGLCTGYTIPGTGENSGGSNVTEGNFTAPAIPEGSGSSTSSASVQDKATFLMVLRVIRLARIVRIAKLSRHSRNLNTLIKTMKTSLRELSFLMLFFIVSMILFSTFIYFCEVNDNGTMFPSIPAAFWWAIVTMTTVGYGDMYPMTPLGKVVGFFCALCGVLCIALPVPSIVSNFHRLYQEDQIMNPHGNFNYSSKDEETRCKLRKKFLSDV